LIPSQLVKSHYTNLVEASGEENIAGRGQGVLYSIEKTKKSCYIYSNKASRRITMQTADLLIKAIKTLPENRVAEVLDFVEFIKQKETREPLNNAETRASIKEIDDIPADKIPNTLKSFNSPEEIIVDLDSDE
jgi:hypothetical protein